MADSALVTVEASPETAAPYLAAIHQCAARAVAYFEEQPPGEPGTVYVGLTMPTGYGVITIGGWSFIRDAEGAVTLIGSEPEASDG
jgi:hypothetical protein